MTVWRGIGLLGTGIAASAAVAAGTTAPATLPDEAFAVLKNRCVKCHGPARQDGNLNLAIPQGIVRGGSSGTVVVRGRPDRSLLWKRVASGEMPQGEVMPAAEKTLLRRWIEAGAPGLPAQVSARADGDEHWAFQKLRPVPLPAVRDASRIRTPIDRFIQAKLEAVGLTLSPEADRATLIRRVSFDLTGLPPSPAEVEAFLNDRRPDAYAQMVERTLAAPRYGERWGKYWLDAAGYADSNGYFGADTDRPLAYRYRDYVIRSVNADKPWDQFLREQLAGDELAGYRPGGDVRPEMVELLEATHFLRNSPDGTDSSDGNPDEVRADKYAVLEGTLQIMGSSLLGLTVQCARCHDHKFEPFTQKDYYRLQAVLYPAFNVEKWVFPKNRIVNAATAAEMQAWEAESRRIDSAIAEKRREWTAWASRHRERGRVLFHDDFDAPGQRLASAWSNTAPGDSQPAGRPAVQLDSPAAPGAQIVGGRLKVRESGSPGDRALSTRQAFDWVPPAPGAWVQATFDLVGGAETAPYIGYYLGLRDYAGQHDSQGGNVLLDGAAAGKATVHLTYPAKSTGRGQIGRSGYTPGHNYGVRVTNVGNGRVELAQVVDGVPEEGTVTLAARELGSGGFGFEYCCGRSFVVDNVTIEAGNPASEADPERRAQAEALRRKRAEVEAAVKALEASRPARPGQLAAVSDLAPEAPRVPLLIRGEYKSPGEGMTAGAPAVLSEPANPSDLDRSVDPPRATTGRRLAFARWLTQPGSRAAARLSRVTVNRFWSYYFGTGLVPTPDNLGYSAAPASHPELLEYLASVFARPDMEPGKPAAPTLRGLGWSTKALHRLILNSAVYRQSSRPTPLARQKDEDGRLLSRFPLRRLDAEAIRDGMLTISGELDLQMGGPYVPTSRDGEGDVVVGEHIAGARRRSVYLQQRRTQVPGLLEVFDAPSIVFNCTARTPTTVPLQSLKLLNSGFVRTRAAALAARLAREAGDDPDARLDRAYLLIRSRLPAPRERERALDFLAAQEGEYGKADPARDAAWIDLCQMLLSSNAFLYVE